MQYTTLFRLAYIAACMSVFSEPALAHHSFAPFDRTEKISVNGTVKELQWGNPHVWLKVIAPDKDGVLEEWSFEATGISPMRRIGWSPTVVKPGDKLVVEAHPLKDGRRGGQLLSVVLPDGKVLKAYQQLEDDLNIK